MTPAARLQAWLRSLSDRERLLLLLGAVAVLGVLLYRAAVVPALASYRKDRAAIPQRMGTLARYRLAAQGEPRIDEAFAEKAALLEELEEGLLPGDNPAAAGAALQGIMKPWVARPDTRLTSVRALTPTPKGGYAEVAVQMDLQTTTEGLSALLTQAARYPGILRVKKLSVSSGYYGAAAVARRETLVVSVVVAGMANADVEAKKAERGEE